MKDLIPLISRALALYALQLQIRCAEDELNSRVPGISGYAAVVRLREYENSAENIKQGLAR